MPSLLHCSESSVKGFPPVLAAAAAAAVVEKLEVEETGA